MGTGIYNQGTMKDFWEYDPSTNTWTQKADFGGPARRGAVAFVVNGKGYVTSGWSATGLYNDLWEYNPIADTWQQKANFGGLARSGAVALVIDDKAYIGTGLSGGSAASDSLNDWWLYDDAKDQWLQQTNVPGRERYGAQAFTLLGKGYVGTGNFSYGMGAVRGFWQFTPAQ